MDYCIMSAFGVNLGSAIVTSGAYRLLTTYPYKNEDPRGGGLVRKSTSTMEVLVMYYCTRFQVSDNPPIDKLHQLLTPLPAAALLFASLLAYSLTGKRVGGGM